MPDLELDDRDTDSTKKHLSTVSFPMIAPQRTQIDEEVIQRRAFELQITQMNAEISIPCYSPLLHLLSGLAKPARALFFNLLSARICGL
ncbi:MAG: hypothetical protein K9L82_19780 [Chromatiaceae bacterium]|nr:hypothetical protein [Chromatiaceae bacterium]MCF8016951.1 hypothetical protein [Chromatiaceae bacterium]